MTSIQVVIRNRPLRPGENGANFDFNGESKRIVLGPKVFDCDGLIPAEASQTTVFENYAKTVIDTVVDGGRGTVMVYGQTGTGKTHTMFGAPSGEPDGIVFQAVSRILNSIAGSPATLCVSVMEVYMEKVSDLISKKEAIVQCGNARGLTWTTISSVTEAADLIFTALKSRHVTATAMNERSSRSHLIVNLKILRQTISSESGDEQVEASQLTLVDLAGSECVGKSKVVGKAAQETASINKSLLALKLLILQLTSPNQGHINYRDSKLTELLQESIGGCSRTMLIACISPSARDLEETKSTLEYATKARQIKNLAQTDRERLNIKVKGLEFELQKMKNKFDQQTSERGQVVVTKNEYDELTAASTRLQEVEVALREALVDKEKSADLLQYRSGIEKVLRDENADLRKQMDEMHAARGGLSRTITDMIADMQGQVHHVYAEYALNVAKAYDEHSTRARAVPFPKQSLDHLSETLVSLENQTKKAFEDVFVDIRSRLEFVKHSDSILKAHKDYAAQVAATTENIRKELRALESINHAYDDSYNKLSTYTLDARIVAEYVANNERHFTLSTKVAKNAFDECMETYKKDVCDTFLDLSTEVPTSNVQKIDAILKSTARNIVVQCASPKKTEKRLSEETKDVTESRGNSVSDPKRRKKVLSNSTNIVAGV